jgi:membrane protein
MSKEIEEQIDKIPVVNKIVELTKQVYFPKNKTFSLYDLLELYVLGIFKGAFSYRASAIAFSFFMALFPFSLFILNLVPLIPIDNFQNDFLGFVEQGVPPTTFEAIKGILLDIMSTSYGSLLSTGFILSVFLMTNGINAILGGFELSTHITVNRGFLKQYGIALLISLALSFLLLFTVVAIVVFEVLIQQIKIKGYINNDIYLIQYGRYLFVTLMILITVSVLYKYGTKETNKISFISYGSVFTTILFGLTSFLFGIYVVKFSTYNELYGSIGTLLVLMFYIWINCMVLLLGFELNASLSKLKSKKSLSLQ